MNPIEQYVNIVMHMLILFTFLSAFYLFYITTVSTEAIEGEIGEGIDKGVDALVQGNESTIQPLLSNVPLDTLETLYQGQEKGVEINNQWFTKMVVMVNIGLWVMFVVVITMMMKKYDEKIDMVHIISLNAVTFAFVGIVEFVFFKYIASKYAPVKPSFLVKEFLDGFKENLTK